VRRVNVPKQTHLPGSQTGQVVCTHQCYTHSRSHAACSRSLIDPSTGSFRNHSVFNAPSPSSSLSHPCQHLDTVPSNIAPVIVLLAPTVATDPPAVFRRDAIPCHSITFTSGRRSGRVIRPALVQLGPRLVWTSRLEMSTLLASWLPGPVQPRTWARRRLRISNHGFELWRRDAHRSENNCFCPLRTRRASSATA
jgi:hypothetical protein